VTSCTSNELKVANNVLQGRDKEIFILQSEIVEAKGSKAELQALYVHAPLSLAVYSILIDHSLSEARATAKLAEENTKKAEMSLVEESCKTGETQGRCDFLETELGREEGVRGGEEGRIED
jgi:hypothetical protein